MTKIVLNTNYGLFSLPRDCYNVLAAARGLPIENERDTVYPYDIDRTDPLLVRIVEAMPDKGDLSVITLRSGAHYRIHDYDGWEYIEYRDDIAWKVAS